MRRVAVEAVLTGVRAEVVGLTRYSLCGASVSARTCILHAGSVTSAAGAAAVFETGEPGTIAEDAGALATMASFALAPLRSDRT